MAGREFFQDINRRGDRFSFAVFRRLRKIQLVEQHVAELLRRIDVEFRSAAVVNFLGLDLNLSFQPLRHFAERAAINGNAGLLHASEHRDQGQINFFV